MRMERKSILNRANLLLIPMFIFIILIFICIIHSMRSSNDIFTYYTDRYYTVADFDVKLNTFEDNIERYNSLGVDANYNQVVEYYERYLRPASTALYDARFNYGKNDSAEIEEAHDVVINNINSDIAILLDDPEAGYSALKADFVIVDKRISNVYNSYVKEGNEAYATKKAKVYTCEVIMVIVLTLFACIAIYLVFYNKIKIARPINEIADWARLFRDDYAEMSNITYESNDEIGDLVESFNTVRSKLLQVNALKKQNETALRKLKEEEEYKKKFVQQLYDEKREKESISSEAKRDGLTGLYNRRSFDALIDDFIGNKPASVEGALFLIDMDFFKNVNDTLGHLAGDEALKTLAGAMRIVFPGGYLGRYGGDEFIAFITGVSEEAALKELGNTLCEKMDRMFEYGGKSVKISVSIGVVNTVGISDYAELYMGADKALYYSKEHGRNQCTIASELDA